MSFLSEIGKGAAKTFLYSTPIGATADAALGGALSKGIDNAFDKAAGTVHDLQHKDENKTGNKSASSVGDDVQLSSGLNKDALIEFGTALADREIAKIEDPQKRAALELTSNLAKNNKAFKEFVNEGKIDPSLVTQLSDLALKETDPDKKAQIQSYIGLASQLSQNGGNVVTKAALDGAYSQIASNIENPYARLGADIFYNALRNSEAIDKAGDEINKAGKNLWQSITGQNKQPSELDNLKTEMSTAEPERQQYLQTVTEFADSNGKIKDFINKGKVKEKTIEAIDKQIEKETDATKIADLKKFRSEVAQAYNATVAQDKQVPVDYQAPAPAPAAANANKPAAENKPAETSAPAPAPADTNRPEETNKAVEPKADQIQSTASGVADSLNFDDLYAQVKSGKIDPHSEAGRAAFKKYGDMYKQAINKYDLEVGNKPTFP